MLQSIERDIYGEDHSGRMLTRCLEGRMLRDVGSVYKLPLPMFSDGDGDWSLWSARFEINVELTGWSTVLSMAASQVAPISVKGPPAKSIRLIKIIYAVLLTNTEEKTLNLVHLTSRRADAEFWRLLRAEYWDLCCTTGCDGAKTDMPA